MSVFDDLVGYRKGLRPVQPESFQTFVDQELERIGIVTSGAVAAIKTVGAAVVYTVAARAATFTEASTSGEKLNLCAGTMTANLPTAVGNTAKLLFKLTAAGTLTLDGSGTETIDGAATLVISTVNQSVTLYSDNANWFAA